ncbi:MAG: DUF4367 domain-containing protein [Eubacterium sp.]|nr:DUF4367 domain-containing protein [Eubacterium sp.]
MTEDRFKMILQGYVNEEMKLLINDNRISEHPSYSKKFNRKMKRIKRSAELFDGNMRLYLIFTRAAAVILIVFTLIAANQASAVIFGFNPWKELTKGFLSDVKMEIKTYEKKDTKKMGLMQPISDEPVYVPEGYNEIDRQETSSIIALEWEKSNDDGAATGLAYSREKMSEDAVFFEDAEYNRVENVEIAGYEAKIYYKSDIIWIDWIDENYTYMIWTSDIEEGGRIISKMAESIYKK